MHTDNLILSVWSLIVLVAITQTSQKVLLKAHQGVHSETGYREALTDTSKYRDRNEYTIPNISKPNQKGSSFQIDQEEYLPSKAQKSNYNKSVNDPVKRDTREVKKSNKADNSHDGQIPRYKPNIVNNYVTHFADTLYNDGKTKNNDYPDCTLMNTNSGTRVKKSANKNVNKSESDTGNHFNVKESVSKENKDSIHVKENSDTVKTENVNTKVFTETTDTNDHESKNLKTPSKRSKKKNRKISNTTLTEKNSNFEDFSIKEGKTQEEFINKNSTKLKKKIKINANTSKTSNEKADKKEIDNNSKKSSTKIVNQISKKNYTKSHDQPNKQKQSKKIRIDKNMKNSQQKEKNPEQYKEKQINKGNKKRNKEQRNFPFGSNFQIPQIQYDGDIHKYMNSILENFHIPNTQLSKSSLFNYNNIYQYPHPPYWSTNRGKPKNRLLMRRKQRNYYKKRFGRKGLNTRKKNTEQKLIEDVNIENDKFEAATPVICLKALTTSSLNPGEGLKEKLSEHSVIEDKIASIKESDPAVNLDNSTIPNEESLNYNSHPSFIIGMDDDVPIIFENGLIDEYYPDFTADGEIFDEETLPSKYHYVSNQYADFKDYEKTNQIAMENMNESSNLIFTENEDITEVEPTISKEEKEERSSIQFQSPPLLDNPDFRTRKIERNGKYEPYYNHEIMQDSKDFNKHNKDDKSVVYSTSMSSKQKMRNKLFNDIDDEIKSKWKRFKDSKVETIHARSKLAKYGLNF